MAAPTSPRSDTPSGGATGWRAPSNGGGGPDSRPSWSVRGAGQRPDPDRWFDDEVEPVASPRSRPPSPPPPRPRTVTPPRAKNRARTRAAAARPAAPPKRRPSTNRRRSRSSSRPGDEWSRVAPVYDVDGPRIRLGLAWFAAIAVAVMVSPFTAAVGYAVAAGLAARQVVLAWRGVSWQADLAAGLAVVPILASALGSGAGVAALVLAAAVAFAAGLQAPNAGLRGGAGRAAAAGVMVQAVVPVAIAGEAMVVLRSHSVAAAVILVLLASAYEMGDFLVGSAASNPVEGPLAGGAAVVVVGFPMALLLVEPFDVMGAALLGIAAVCCPVGQWIASAILPRPGADAPALRRIDTLLLLAPVWVIAAGAL